MTESRARWLPTLVGGGVCLAALAVAQVRIGYFLDDWLHLTLSRAMPHPVDPFFHDRMLGSFFRPLGGAWWWLLAHLGDPGPDLRHLLALLLHALAAAAVGLAAGAWRKNRTAGGAAGLLWLTSPIALADVGWLSCAYDLLAAIFIALTLWRGIAFTRNGRRRDLPMITLCALAACWSKESAYILPLIGLPLLLGAVGADRRRAGIALGAITAAVIVALLHRYAILGQWVGGYRELRPVRWSDGLRPFLAAMQQQTPWWMVRPAAMALLILATFGVNRESRKPLATGLAATVAALLPALFMLRSPSMLAVLPARYLSAAALLSVFPAAGVIAAWTSRQHLKTALLALMMLVGMAVAWLSADVAAQRAAGEREQVEVVLDRLRDDPSAKGAVICETSRAVVGMDAAVKTLAPALLGKVTVLNCAFPTHVIIPKRDARRLRPYWTKRLPTNPSRGFGLVWGEAQVGCGQCRRLTAAEE